MDCYGTYNCGTVWEELLTPEVAVGSLLRAALDPQTRASLANWGYYDDQAMALPDFLDHPMEESRRRVRISSETHPVYVQIIYVPSILVWDWRHVEWKFVVQMSSK